ncbi:terminase small subunit [Dyadobacter sp. LHD-138]|uniref:terminase small subunit n=1 Tax=Dyadobacter sp. LHD-138 TaxID=3071413 RepID=UPI0027E1E6F9|nr:terminase small subunit [Dyadobacter sp. LHD-138]MDQ6482341.1 terminase small subunit [Dyadobacter sp. LHD-138]
MDEKLTKLSLKQQRFVEEYCIDFNATAAAKRAGYSEKTAYSIGSENLIKPEIKKAVAELTERMTMSAEEAMIRMSQFARGSLASFLSIDERGRVLVDLSTPEAQSNLQLLKKIKQTQTTIVEDITSVYTEIELVDSMGAVAKMLQIHGKGVDRTVTLKSKIDNLSDQELNSVIDQVLQTNTLK